MTVYENTPSVEQQILEELKNISKNLEKIYLTCNNCEVEKQILEVLKDIAKNTKKGGITS